MVKSALNLDNDFAFACRIHNSNQKNHRIGRQEVSMRILRRQRMTHAVSTILSLLGVAFISYTVWRESAPAWPAIVARARAHVRTLELTIEVLFRLQWKSVPEVLIVAFFHFLLQEERDE